jgi:hypothetical protein
MTATAEPASVEPAPQKRIPDFFIVGHAKCGTTALYEMLRRHRQIYMPDYKLGAGKEPWYFARDNPHPQTNGERSIAFTGRNMGGFDDYLSLFEDARPEQRVGEASSSYLWSRSAAARIAAVRPDARIIAIIREPASFLRSLHLQLLENHHESEKSFRKAVELDDARREGRHIPSYSYWPAALIYSDRVRYVEQLRRYHDVFAPEQVLVLIYDDFRADNDATVRRVLRFLDVDDSAPIEVVEANPTVGVRSVRFDNLRRQLHGGGGPALAALRGMGRTLTSRRLREGVLYPLQRRAVYGKPPPPDEAFMQELRRRYRGEVVALSEYLGRDLVALWGYDDLG